MLCITDETIIDSPSSLKSSSNLKEFWIHKMEKT